MRTQYPFVESHKVFNNSQALVMGRSSEHEEKIILAFYVSFTLLAHVLAVRLSSNTKVLEQFYILNSIRFLFI